MVSNADNPNFLFLEPFIKWIQEVYQDSVGLRVFKRLTTVGRTGSYVTLTNIGKKKSDDPVKVFVRIKKIGIQLASFEIYDTLEKKYIYFEVDDLNFRFSHRYIDDVTIKNVDNYQESPYNHDVIPEELHTSGASNVASPASSRPSSARETSASPSTNENDGNSNPSVSSASSVQSNPPKTVQKEIISVEEESENELLKRELERTTCEILILNIEKEALMRKVIPTNGPQPDQFNIMNYKVIKALTMTSMGSRLYAVEHVHKHTKHTLREAAFNRFTALDQKLCFKVEIETLKELASVNEKSPHLLMLQGFGQDSTPLRQSHYVLYESAVMGLEEFSFNFMKKNSIPIIVTQILKGLNFMSDKLFKVHGNINVHSVVLDSQWNVKLTNFQYSLSISQQVDPRRILTGKSDHLTKHPHIFEQLERRQPLVVNQSIDRWAIGCLFYKLLYEGELFLNSTNYRSHPSLISTITTLPHGRILFAFFDDYNRIITPAQILNSEFFRRYHDIKLGALYNGSNQWPPVPQQDQHQSHGSTPQPESQDPYPNHPQQQQQNQQNFSPVPPSQQ